LFNKKFIGYKNEKFTNFVDSSIDKIADSFIFLISSKYFLYFTASLIALTSIFIRSIHDIGPDTAFYLYLGEKIAKGGKYYYDFFDPNFPISFYIYALQYRIASFFAINPIIFSDFFINITALISLFFSARFLKKTTIYSDKIAYNLLIIGFYLGFFIRYPAIELLEFGTKSSFLAILFYPYFALSLQREAPLTTSEKLIRGLLGGLIPCFKPHYLIYIIAIELVKWRFDKHSKNSQNKAVFNFSFFIQLDKIIIFAVGAIYLLIIWLFIPEFLQMIKIFSDYYPGNQFNDALNSFFDIVATCYFILYLFPFLIFKNQQKLNSWLIFSIVIFAILCLKSEGINSIDQNGAVIAIVTGPILLLARYFFNSQYFSLHKNIFSVSLLLLMPFLPAILFSGVEFITFASLLIIFQPIFLYYFNFNNYLDLQAKKYFFAKIIRNLLTQLFIILLVIVIVIFFIKIFFIEDIHLTAIIRAKRLNLFFIILTIINLYFLCKNELLIKKMSLEKYHFSKLLVFLFLVSLTKFIFNYCFYSYANIAKKNFYDNKNDVISKTEHYIKKYAKNNADNFIVSGSHPSQISFPALNYFQRQAVSKAHSLQSFFDLNENLRSKVKIFAEDNHRAVFDKNTKILFFVRNIRSEAKNSCRSNKISDYLLEKKPILEFFNQYEYAGSFYNSYLGFDIISGQSIKLRSYVEVYARKKSVN